MSPKNLLDEKTTWVIPPQSPGDDWVEVTGITVAKVFEWARKLWPRSRGGRPKKTQLAEHEEKCAKAYQARLKRGVSKENAAMLEGHDVDTLDGWVKLLEG